MPTSVHWNASERDIYKRMADPRLPGARWTRPNRPSQSFPSLATARRKPQMVRKVQDASVWDTGNGTVSLPSAPTAAKDHWLVYTVTVASNNDPPHWTIGPNCPGWVFTRGPQRTNYFNDDDTHCEFWLGRPSTYTGRQTSTGTVSRGSIDGEQYENTAVAEFIIRNFDGRFLNWVYSYSSAKSAWSQQSPLGFDRRGAVFITATGFSAGGAGIYTPTEEASSSGWKNVSTATIGHCSVKVVRGGNHERPTRYWTSSRVDGNACVAAVLR